MAHKKETVPATDETLAKAKKDAFRLLAFRARSTQELRSRLARKGYAPDVSGAVVDYFIGQGLLDDEKFAKLYAISRLQSRPSGKRQIAFDLKTKGVPAAAVQRALGSLEDFDEKEVALGVAQSRHKNMKELPEKVSKARLYGFLMRRGFTSEAIFYALGKLYATVENFE